MTSDAHGPVISVMLAVPDAAAAARWYAPGLGATELWDLGGHCCIWPEDAVSGAKWSRFPSRRPPEVLKAYQSWHRRWRSGIQVEDAGLSGRQMQQCLSAGEARAKRLAPLPDHGRACPEPERYKGSALYPANARVQRPERGDGQRYDPTVPRQGSDQRFRWSVPVWSPPPESNRRPHPYHGTTRNRCAERPFPRSRPTVGAEVGSPSARLYAHSLVVR
jgi:hypothetical protein